MPRPDLIRAECLSLLAGLYGALSDDERYAERRTACEAWLFQHRGRHEAVTAFLRRQISRAAEARQVARELGGGSGRVAAVMVEDGLEVVAAGPEAWDLLQSGHPSSDPLRLPAILSTHLDATLKSGARFPKAMRILPDQGTRELAGVLLGVEEMPQRRGKPRRVATLLLWDLASEGRAAVASVGAPALPMFAGLELDRKAASDE
jgi:hypothetical protein